MLSSSKHQASVLPSTPSEGFPPVPSRSLGTSCHLTPVSHVQFRSINAVQLDVEKTSREKPFNIYTTTVPTACVCKEECGDFLYVCAPIPHATPKIQGKFGHHTGAPIHWRPWKGRHTSFNSPSKVLRAPPQPVVGDVPSRWSLHHSAPAPRLQQGGHGKISQLRGLREGLSWRTERTMLSTCPPTFSGKARVLLRLLGAPHPRIMPQEADAWKYRPRTF